MRFLIHWCQNENRCPSSRCAGCESGRRRRLQTKQHAFAERLEDRALLSLDPGWVFGLGATGGRDLTFDSSGDPIVLGRFKGTVDFDPNDPGQTNTAAILTSGGGGGVYDAFLAKYTPSGSFLWAIHFDGPGTTSSSSVIGTAAAFDPLSNSIYVTGSISGTVDFSANGTLVRTGNTFVERLDAGTGQPTWVVTGAGSGGNATSLALDANGNPYSAGEYNGTFTITPTSGPTVSLSNAGLDDAFVLKLTPTGQIAWAKGFGGTGYDDINGIAISHDSSNNQYVNIAGSFSSPTLAVGSTTLKNAGGTDIFLAKLAAIDGSTQWAESVGGVGTENANAIAVDSGGDVYATGDFGGRIGSNSYLTYTVDFNPNPSAPPTNLTSLGSEQSFVLKLDPAGNFLWAKAVGQFDQAEKVAVDSAGNVFSAGRFNNTANFDPGSGSFYLTAPGNGHGYISKLDPSGNFLGAWEFGGTQGAAADFLGMATYLDPVTSTQWIYVATNFAGTAFFPTGGSLTDPLSTLNVFVMKLNTQLGAIGGTVFDDLNNDGVNNDGAALGNWTVNLEQSSTVVATTTTDQFGHYSFVSLAPGTYAVVEVVKPGWSATAPPGGTSTVTIGSQFAEGTDLGAFTPNTTKTYTSTNVPLTIPKPSLSSSASVMSTLNVSDTASILHLKVTLNISEKTDTTLTIYLTHAATGTKVELYPGSTGAGANFNNTTFDDAASSPITGGTAPYSGTFQPFTYLASFNGESAQGQWQLEIDNAPPGYRGTLNSWSITVTEPTTSGVTMAPARAAGALVVLAPPSASATGSSVAGATLVSIAPIDPSQVAVGNFVIAGRTVVGLDDSLVQEVSQTLSARRHRGW
jgi:subtilisin-like proprotein convertase family protein